VLSGGGTRLAAFVGAILALRDLGAEIVRVAGVSGGSVVGAFLAAGIDRATMRDLAVQTDYRRFADISPLAILTGHGLSAGRRFEHWLDRQLHGARFADLALDFRVVAADVLTYEPVVFSRTTTPDVRVAEAVRCSMGIPGYFAYRRWRDHLLVDGALVPNAQWTVFDAERDARTIYVLLASAQRSHVPPPPRRRRFLWTWEYAFRLVWTLMRALENRRVPADRWRETVLINTGDLDTIDFALTPEQKLALVDEGYRQIQTYLVAKSDLFATSG